MIYSPFGPAETLIKSFVDACLQTDSEALPNPDQVSYSFGRTFRHVKRNEAATGRFVLIVRSSFGGTFQISVVCQLDEGWKTASLIISLQGGYRTFSFAGCFEGNTIRVARKD